MHTTSLPWCSAAKQSGMFSCVVRYNARGVGSSVGPRKGGVQVGVLLHASIMRQPSFLCSGAALLRQ